LELALCPLIPSVKFPEEKKPTPVSSPAAPSSPDIPTQKPNFGLEFKPQNDFIEVIIFLK
jgi:hypothetical protein